MSQTARQLPSLFFLEFIFQFSREDKSGACNGNQASPSMDGAGAAGTEKRTQMEWNGMEWIDAEMDLVAQAMMNKYKRQ